MKLLHHIRNIAHNQPHTIAYITPNQEITYGELWDQSERVAAFIKTQTLEKKLPILLYGHMDVSLVVSFLGSVKAGHPYIPVDISIPPERINHIITSAKPGLIINTTNQLLPCNDCNVRTIAFEQILVDLPVSGPVDPSNWVKGNDNFYIIYTSGSTGTPKGVQISVNNLQSFLDWMVEDFPINGQLRFLNQAPYSFDLSVMDLYPALMTGGTLFAVTKEMIEKPKFLFEELRRSNAHVWTSTPSFAQMCLMDPSFNEELLPELSVFLFCGEVLPPGICQQLMTRFPRAKCFNTYGPTEATVAVTSIEISNEIMKDCPTLPIGKPKQDTQILLLDENGNLVSNGEKGEIIIVGPGVSKGYLGQPELTDKAFFTYKGEQAYRTGDAGFMDSRGHLFYQGRIDFQIKLHGYRMELEEIEYQLSQSPFVQSALVIPIDSGEKIEYLLAAIIPAKHTFEKEYQLTSAIKKDLSRMIPAYMIPRKFTYFNELPMTANGKMDRKRIKELVLL